MKSRITPWGLLFLTVLMAGCGGSDRPSLVEATGEVKLDGTPVSNAQIFLEYVGTELEFKRPITTYTDDAGKFTLNAYPDESGIPVGPYRMGILKKEQVGDLPKGYDPEIAQNFRVKYQWTVPKKYSTLESSGVTIEATSDGITPAVIELTTDGKPPEEEFIGGQKQNDA